MLLFGCYCKFSWTLHSYVMLRYCKLSWTLHSCVMLRYCKFYWTFHSYVMLRYCNFSWTSHSSYVMLRYCKFSWTLHSYAMPRYCKFSWTLHPSVTQYLFMWCWRCSLENPLGRTRSAALTKRRQKTCHGEVVSASAKKTKMLVSSRRNTCFWQTAPE